MPSQPDFDDADEDALAAGIDVPRDPQTDAIVAETLQDMRQSRTQRWWLFWLVMVLVPASLVATIALMITLIHRGGAGDTVYVAFISATAVQSLGLVATLVRNLYRPRAAVRGRSSRSPE